MAVAADGGGLELGPTGWVDMYTKPKVDVHEMAGNDVAGLWMVGSQGLVLTHTDTGWTSVDSGTDKDLNDVLVSEDGAVWMVGDEGRIIHVTVDGEIVASNVGVPVALNGVALGPEHIYVCGKGGTLMKSTLEPDATFTPILSGTPADLNLSLIHI